MVSTDDRNDGEQLDQFFWNSRYENNQMGWDIGYASPAITSFMQTYPNKDAAILIPGCGNAHEADFLLKHGFTNITLIDIAPTAVKKLQLKYEQNPEIKVICGDFFEHHGQYDLMIEQTFFCAISPSLRTKYVTNAANLLTKNGKIIGLLFNTEFEKKGPPFGGNTESYQSVFEQDFIIQKMETCTLSIPQRTNREVFIHLIKKI